MNIWFGFYPVFLVPRWIPVLARGFGRSSPTTAFDGVLFFLRLCCHQCPIAPQSLTIVSLKNDDIYPGTPTAAPCLLPCACLKGLTDRPQGQVLPIFYPSLPSLLFYQIPICRLLYPSLLILPLFQTCLERTQLHQTFSFLFPYIPLLSAYWPIHLGLTEPSLKSLFPHFLFI